jgi:hypothetical protein
MQDSRTKWLRAPAYLARGASLAVGLALAAQCAACAPTTLVYNPGHVPTDKMSQIQDVCAMVARLPIGSSQDYDVCQESLSRSFASHLKSERLWVARQDCLARGETPGTTSLSVCELDGQASPARPSAEKVSDQQAPKLAVSGSGLNLRHREQRACADIGFDPVGQGFGQCVADLDAELTAVHRPIM